MRRSRLRARVETRALGRCEYCHAPQAVCGYRFHLEHVLPVALGGSDGEENRALSCAPCNLAKANRVAAADPLTGSMVPLYDPRTQDWHEHFHWADDGRTLNAATATGRATVATLEMNSVLRGDARQLWFAVGLLPHVRH